MKYHLFDRDAYLMHHGVKGMKWGIRKDRSRNGVRKQRFNKALNITRNYTGSRGSNALKEARKKDINKMSNRELQETINRLNLERNYRSLTRVDYMRGQKYAADYLKMGNTYNGVKNSASVKRGRRAVATAYMAAKISGYRP